MKLILVGPQGSGKGTQAQRLTKILNVPHISTGDIFRENIKNNTELGALAKSYIDNGNLVPDSVTIDLVKDRLSKDDCKNGFILDGFPRNLEQAKALSEFVEIDNVLVIDLEDSESIKRISNRRTCSVCGKVYNILTNPPKEEGICDIDQGKLIQRDDDTEEAIKKRLEIYHKETQPIIDYFSEKSIIVDGSKSIDEVTEEIKQKLNLN